MSSIAEIDTKPTEKLKRQNTRERGVAVQVTQFSSLFVLLYVGRFIDFSENRLEIPRL